MSKNYFSERGGESMSEPKRTSLTRPTGSTSEAPAGQSSDISSDHTHMPDNILSITSLSLGGPRSSQGSMSPSDEKILWRLRALLNTIRVRAGVDDEE